MLIAKNKLITGSPNFDRIQAISEKTFDNHQITVLVETPLFKKYRYGRPDRWAYGFYVVHAADITFMDGDLEFGAWRRNFETLRDIFQRQDSYQLTKYWLREIENKEFSYDKVIEAANWELENMEEDCTSRLGWEHVLYMAKNHYEEDLIIREIYDACDGSDFPNVRDYTPSFCWSVLAMQNFFKAYDLLNRE